MREVCRLAEKEIDEFEIINTYIYGILRRNLELYDYLKNTSKNYLHCRNKIS